MTGQEGTLPRPNRNTSLENLDSNGHSFVCVYLDDKIYCAQDSQDEEASDVPSQASKIEFWSAGYQMETRWR